MDELIEFIIEQLSALIPDITKLEFGASITDTSRTFEFFVTIAGERFQCNEMVDDGRISDEALDSVFATIANHWRMSTFYKKGQINKMSFIYEKD